MSISLLIFLFSTFELCKCKTPEEREAFMRNTENSIRNTFLLISGGLLIFTIVRLVRQRFLIPIPQVVFEIFISLLYGVVCLYSEHFLAYAAILQKYDAFLVQVYLPILVYSSAITLDVHNFYKSLTQILIYSIPVTMLNVAIVGFAMNLIIDNTWSNTHMFLFGFMCYPIYPKIVLHTLQEMGGYTKHIGALLHGESVVGSVFALICFKFILIYYSNPMITWYNYLKEIAICLTSNVLIGMIVGLLGSCWMRSLYFDPVNLALVTVTLPTMTFLLVDVFIEVSGSLSVAIIGILMSLERSSSPEKIDKYLCSFWKMTRDILNSVIYLIVSIEIAVRVFATMGVKDFMFSFVTYLIVYTIRLFTFALVTPLMPYFGLSVSFKEMLVSVWVGLKSPVCLVMTMLFHSEYEDKLAEVFVTHVSMLYLLSFLLNGSTVECVLRFLKQMEFTLVRNANMDNSIRHAMLKRTQTIAVLKMDRLLADANWPLVNTATTLRHPYDNQMLKEASSKENDYFVIGTRVVLCPDCKTEFSTDPTPRQMRRMMRDAKLRILKAKKISYSKQFEDGMLSQEAMRSLNQAADVAMDTESAQIDLEGIYKLFKKESVWNQCLRKCVVKLFGRDEEVIRMPRRGRRRIFYRLVTHKCFEVFILWIIVISVVPIALEFVYKPKPWQPLYYTLIAVNTLLFLIYFFEFTFKVYAFAWIYVCRDGIPTYFKSCWNSFDFVILLAALTDLLLAYVDLILQSLNKSEKIYYQIILGLRSLRLLDFLKTVQFHKVLYPRVIKFCNSRSDYHITFAYEIGKGFVTGEEDILEILPYMIDDEKIINSIKWKLEEDRLALTKMLCVMQKDRPRIAVTTKTKHAMTTILNSMKDAINELKVSGWADDVEYLSLMKALGERYKYVTSVKLVVPNLPREIVKEVLWMSGEDVIVDYLLQNMTSRQFTSGDKICNDGDMTNGIYIIVTGFLKLSYIPRPEVLKELVDYGILPVLDYMASTNYNDCLSEYILPGNCVGELGSLVQRPYNCTIIAETYTFAYLLTHEVLLEAMKLSDNPVDGLECRLWKSASINIAAAILKDVPVYRSASKEKIRYALERAVVPKLSDFKILIVNDSIEDVILIEGLALDLHTRNIYIAPTYIPRTVQKLMLTFTSKFQMLAKVQTRLMIIPPKDIEDYVVVEKGEGICELENATSSRCLLHSAQERLRMLKKRKMRGLIDLTRSKKMRSKSIVGGSRSAMRISSKITQDNTSRDDSIGSSKSLRKIVD